MQQPSKRLNNVKRKVVSAPDIGSASARFQTERVAALAEAARSQGPDPSAGAAAAQAGASGCSRLCGTRAPVDSCLVALAGGGAWFSIKPATGIWRSIAGALSFVFYHTEANPHPAMYALEPDFDTDSTEFRYTMAGMTGMPLVDGNRVDIYNNGDEFYPAMLEAIESARDRPSPWSSSSSGTGRWAGVSRTHLPRKGAPEFPLNCWWTRSARRRWAKRC